jgi:uncharacterized membrane protein YedE/YeeE
VKHLSPFLVGIVFDLGLCLSGMVEPNKVLGFLDLGGAWDPFLALVIGGAVGVAFIAFQLAKGRAKSLTGEQIELPSATAIDASLIGGSVLFGVGWGLVGLCPGLALVDLGYLNGSSAIFAPAMAVGMALRAAVAKAIPLSKLGLAAADG